MIGCRPRIFSGLFRCPENLDAPAWKAAGIAHVAVNDLAYAHPGGDLLFSDVSFRVAGGRHAGIVGVNGVGKSTLLRVIAGELEPVEGTVAVGGRLLAMPQDVGQGAGTVRELLVRAAPAALREAGLRMLAAERALAAGDGAAGVELGDAIGLWSDLGGYELEGRWDASCRRIVRAGLSEVGDREAVTLSGGERKQLVLDWLFGSDAEILLLDEPDNFLDIRAKGWFEERMRATKKTVLLISHDRAVLNAATDMIVTLEGHGCWVHGASYATWAQERAARQRRMGDALARWKEEERRLRELVRTFKERARYSPDWAKRADAAESRWKRFVDAGPPPAPVADQTIKLRLRGGDSGRRVIDFRRVGIDGLVQPFSDEVHYGERVGLIGPNGSGKTHLMRLIAGEALEHSGEVVLGARVSAGAFAQLSLDPREADRTPLSLLEEQVGSMERAMPVLARYGLAEASGRTLEQLSGGQRARFEILRLEVAGHNLLLLDEPTDNLDVESAAALEEALEGFEGTVVAVSHDRAFLQRLDRFLLLDHEGRVTPLPSPDEALAALAA